MQLASWLSTTHDPSTHTNIKGNACAFPTHRASIIDRAKRATVASGLGPGRRAIFAEHHSTTTCGCMEGSWMYHLPRQSYLSRIEPPRRLMRPHVSSGLLVCGCVLPSSRTWKDASRLSPQMGFHWKGDTCSRFDNFPASDVLWIWVIALLAMLLSTPATSFLTTPLGDWCERTWRRFLLLALLLSLLPRRSVVRARSDQVK
jgi:hypothetical protein